MRALKVLGVILGAFLALYLVAYAFRYQTTLPIDGVIVDSKTGKPVSKVLVQAYWHFSRSNLVDTTGDEAVFGTVTDENGRFRIPRKNVTIVLGRFDDQYLLLRHPLYVFEEVQVFCPMRGGYQLGTTRDALLSTTLPITSLSDRYVGPMDAHELADAIRVVRPDFFRVMRDTYGTTYDLALIASEMERLSKRFPRPDGKPSDPEYAFRTFKYFMSDLNFNY